MSLTINGVSPRVINVVSGGSTTELKTLKVTQNGSEKYVWAKPYKLYIYRGSNSALKILRSSSPYALAGTGALSDGSDVYYGDSLTISVHANSGYTATLTINGAELSTSSATMTIDGDLTIRVKEVSNTPQLVRPALSGTFNYNSTEGNYYLSVNIRNNNSVDVTAKIKVYGNGAVLSGSYTKTVSANTTGVYNHGGIYSSGAYVTVMFERSGYNSAMSETTFGNYTSSSGGGSTDETSTTT